MKRAGDAALILLERIAHSASRCDAVAIDRSVGAWLVMGAIGIEQVWRLGPKEAANGFVTAQV